MTGRVCGAWRGISGSPLVAAGAVQQLGIRLLANYDVSGWSGFKVIHIKAVVLLSTSCNLKTKLGKCTITVTICIAGVGGQQLQGTDCALVKRRFTSQFQTKERNNTLAHIHIHVYGCHDFCRRCVCVTCKPIAAVCIVITSMLLLPVSPPAPHLQCSACATPVAPNCCWHSCCPPA